MNSTTPVESTTTKSTPSTTKNQSNETESLSHDFLSTTSIYTSTSTSTSTMNSTTPPESTTTDSSPTSKANPDSFSDALAATSSTPSTKPFSVFSLMVWGSPGAFGVNDKELRMKAIGNWIANDTEHDVYLLNDLWMRADHETIRQSLPLGRFYHGEEESQSVRRIFLSKSNLKALLTNEKLVSD